MRWFLAFAALAMLLACDGLPLVTPDAGSAPPDAGLCSEANEPFCCEGGCHGDMGTPDPPTCESDRWVCPANSASAADCPADAGVFCGGDQPGPLGYPDAGTR